MLNNSNTWIIRVRLSHVRYYYILESINPLIKKHSSVISVRSVAVNITDRIVGPTTFSCKEHASLCRSWALRTIANIFFNNQQKIINEQIRKDQVKDFKSTQRNLRSQQNLESRIKQLTQIIYFCSCFDLTIEDWRIGDSVAVFCMRRGGVVNKRGEGGGLQTFEIENKRGQISRERERGVKIPIERQRFLWKAIF